MKNKNHAPICFVDKMECKPNLTGFMEMDGYLDCHNCPRFHNGVRETGGMPGLEWVVESIKKLFAKIKIKLWIQ